MLAFYIQLLYARTVFLNSHTLQVTVSNFGLGSTFAILAEIDLMATLWSVFRSEIGLQLSKRVLFLSFFGIRVMIPLFGEINISPFSKA